MQETQQHIKRKIYKRPSDKAVRMANDIYYTYIQEDNNVIYISVDRLCEIFGEPEKIKVKIEVSQIFEELNEPIAIENYKYYGDLIKWQSLQFFTYNFFSEDGNEYIELTINELFLDVLEKLESEPFINFH